ncbi:protein GVQW3-like [Schistocerca nitens]|uniref:protein GVQW3-like n=1 Tax=Schistocerca nitens TaxID=7011 RepID=UPI0021192DFC|nr:protein GVQW3-like [Schistocerca nitens]
MAFDDDAMGITQFKVWYNQFKDGCSSVESEPHSGRPLTCRNDQVIAKVNAEVMWNCRVTIREIAEQVTISTSSAHPVVTEDLAIKKESPNFLPKLLMAEQKQFHVEVSQDMFDATNSDPNFVNVTITGDES